MRTRNQRLISIVVAVLATAVFASSAVGAGGVHVTLLTPAPATMHVGQSWTLKIDVWRPNRLVPGSCYRPDPVHHPHVCIHPKSPRLALCCLRPRVILRDQTGQVERSVARPIKPYALDGRYRARVSFPSAGKWTVTIDDGHGGTHRVATISVSR